MKSFNIGDANDAREFLKKYLLDKLPGNLGAEFARRAFNKMTDEQIVAAAKALYEDPKAKERVK